MLTAFCTLLLIIAGGLVTSTGSGLAVPDWPLSYGQVMPPMVGGIFYEHGHRMIATFVGILTLGLAIWLWRAEPRRWVRVLGFVALGSVVIQGVLGGLTVKFLLPTAISVSHAMLAQTFFVIVCSIALFTSRWWLQERTRMPFEEVPSSTITFSFFVILAAYIQLILGALMRHTGSGLAVPDFPLAYGQLFPSLSQEKLAAYNQQLIYSDIRLAAEGTITGSQIIIHMLHRVWAIVVAVLVLWYALKIGKISSVDGRLRKFSYLLIGLVLIQFSLGVLTVLSHKAFELATAHVAAGALLLMACALTALHVLKLSGRFQRSLVFLPLKEKVIA